jgi:MFS family permease
VVQNARRTGQSLGVNGVFGNLGVAAAGLVTGLITGLWGWRAAFILPGVVAILTGILFWRPHRPPRSVRGAGRGARGQQVAEGGALRRVRHRPTAPGRRCGGRSHRR